MDGVTKEIDMKGRILANASDASAVTRLEQTTSMREAIRNAFDDSLVVSNSSGQFTIEDAQVAHLKFQGEGTGYFFGTDEQNNGSLSTEANTQNIFLLAGLRTVVN